MPTAAPTSSLVCSRPADAHGEEDAAAGGVAQRGRQPPDVALGAVLHARLSHAPRPPCGLVDARIHPTRCTVRMHAPRPRRRHRRAARRGRPRGRRLGAAGAGVAGAAARPLPVRGDERPRRRRGRLGPRRPPRRDDRGERPPRRRRLERAGRDLAPRPPGDRPRSDHRSAPRAASWWSGARSCAPRASRTADGPPPRRPSTWCGPRERAAGRRAVEPRHAPSPAPARRWGAPSAGRRRGAATPLAAWHWGTGTSPADPGFVGQVQFAERPARRRRGAPRAGSHATRRCSEVRRPQVAVGALGARGRSGGSATSAAGRSTAVAVARGPGEALGPGDPAADRQRGDVAADLAVTPRRPGRRGERGADGTAVVVARATSADALALSAAARPGDRRAHRRRTPARRRSPPAPPATPSRRGPTCSAGRARAPIAADLGVAAPIVARRRRPGARRRVDVAVGDGRQGRRRLVRRRAASWRPSAAATGELRPAAAAISGSGVVPATSRPRWRWTLRATAVAFWTRGLGGPHRGGARPVTRPLSDCPRAAALGFGRRPAATGRGPRGAPRFTRLRSRAYPLERRRRHPRPGGPVSTIKPPDIDLGQYKFGWHDPANYVFEPKRGLNADVVREISFLKGEPEWMTEVPPPRRWRSSSASPCPTGAGTSSGDRLPEHLLLHPRVGEAEHRLERRPVRHQEHLRPAGHPRGRAEVPLGRERPVRERGRLPLAAARTSRRRASSSATRTPPCASTRTSSRSTGPRSSRPATTSSPR